MDVSGINILHALLSRMNKHISQNVKLFPEESTHLKRVCTQDALFSSALKEDFEKP